MSEMMTQRRGDSLAQQSWESWQSAVLDIIRAEYAGVLEEVSWDDVDWNAWRSLFDAGHSPCDAVQSAFGKVA